MLEAVLFRFSSGIAGTFGNLNGPWGYRLSVELPWRNNRPDVSCIPLGVYPVVWTYSPRFKRHMYLVSQVPGRSGIRLHTANWPHDLEGCIGPGRKLAKFGKPKPAWGVTNSGSTLHEIESIMNHQPFRLHVRALTLPLTA